MFIHTADGCSLFNSLIVATPIILLTVITALISLKKAILVIKKYGPSASLNVHKAYIFSSRPSRLNFLMVAISIRLSPSFKVTVNLFFLFKHYLCDSNIQLS